ncbi:MAG: DUF2807 domain-containing protein [Chloroflexi bacterium]|nr:DUF2807 domain-containing protein [Chloroflexota bacterium]
MKKTLLLSLAALMLAMLACSAGGWEININNDGRFVKGSGNITTETRDVSGFNSIEFNGLGDVEIVQGSEEGLTITTDDNLLPLITTEVKGSTLVIGIEQGYNINLPSKMKFTIQVKDLQKLQISGLANVEADDLALQDLYIGISGGGSVKLRDLIAKDVRLSISGLGNVDLDGEARSVRMDSSGGGNLDAEDLRADSVSISISGVGQASVWAIETLNVEISGGGEVDYYGKPEITRDIDGVGTLNSLGEK